MRAIDDEKIHNYYNKLSNITITAHSVCLSTEAIPKKSVCRFGNEAGQRRELLVHWNKNESFPSLGIGHNIWFLDGQEKFLLNNFRSLHVSRKKWR